MNPPGISREGPPQNATGTESRSAPKETLNLIELVRARHETRIRRTLVDWLGETPAAGRSVPTLTGNQQSNLQERVVDMFVELGEARLVDLFSKKQSPQQFESDSEHLIEIVAGEAQAHWKTLTMRYRAKAEAAEVTADPDVEVQQGVLYQLIRVAERYKLKAWSDLEKLLEAECGSTARVFSDSAIVQAEFSASAVPTLPTVAKRSLAQRVADLRKDKGLSVQELAEKAKVDKKSLIGIQKGSRPHPRTLKRIADALGVTPRELEPDVQNRAAPLPGASADIPT